MNRTRVSILFFVALSMLGVIAACAVDSPALDVAQDAGQRFGAPLNPGVSFNGLDAGFLPNLFPPTCDAGYAWSGGGPGSTGGCSNLAEAGAAAGITQLTGPVTAGPGSGSVATTLAITQDCTASGTAVTCTQLQGGDVTVSTGGQISCASTIAGTCGLTEASTSAGAASLLTIQAQSTTQASSTGGNLYLGSGIATGATAGTPGYVVLDRGVVTGSSTAESSIFFERGNTKDFAFQSAFSGNTYVAIYLGSTNVASPSTGNYALLADQAGVTTYLNGAGSVILAVANSPFVQLTGTTLTVNSPNWVMGLSGSGGTAALNGPARTTTQLIAQTGATLNAGQHYFFLPVNINGQAMQLVMCQ